MSMSMDEALKLRDEVNELIAKAKTFDVREFGAVNWSDIKVVDVCEQKSLITPYRHIFVEIEEAAPECSLSVWLTEQVDRHNVSVRAEW